MIDTHMHISPSVDDGACDLAMAQAMLLSALSQGVTGIFATSHSDAFEYDFDYVHGKYVELQHLVKENDWPVELYLGCEVFCGAFLMKRAINNLKMGIYPTMNGTKYVLAEFYDPEVEEASYCLNELLVNGYIPIIAHAERYPKLDVDFFKQMKSQGCRIQVNAYSICQEQDETIRGKTLELLEQELVDFVGSDAHRMGHRPPEVKTGVDYLRQHFPKEYVERIINAEELI